MDMMYNELKMAVLAYELQLSCAKMYMLQQALIGS